MANITKLEFVALDISGKNYLSWTLDADIHLISQDFGETIKEGNSEYQQDRAKALIFLRNHLHDDLKVEYLTVKGPSELWKNLKERFDHQRTVVLPRARYEWIQLWLQDFKTVSSYNSELFRISSKLKLCGEKITDEDMLEKTFSTFHASNVLLQQQYRERGFKKYSELNIEEGPITIMKVNTAASRDADTPQYVEKPRLKWTADDRRMLTLLNMLTLLSRPPCRSAYSVRCSIAQTLQFEEMMNKEPSTKDLPRVELFEAEIDRYIRWNHWNVSPAKEQILNIHEMII